LKLLGNIEDTSNALPQRRVRSYARIFGPGGLAAAVAAVAVLAHVGFSLWNASLRDENEDLRSSLETRETYDLKGSGPADDTRGEAIEIRYARAVLMAENLPLSGG
jgi:hypothetical protein